MSIKIAIVAGTRPEFIKLAPILKLIELDPELTLVFIHTGQHYDYEMSKVFLKNLNLPTPHFNIEVKSGTHNYQIGTLLTEIENLIEKEKPDVIIAEGDTNTVIATALSSIKSNSCFMHLEAGIRSFDKRMPEEINRILTGACAMYHLVPTERAAINLAFEGIERDKIFIVGNTIVDAVTQIKEIAEKKSSILEDLNIYEEKPIVLITLHRPANVDHRESLELLINAISEMDNFNFIFPIHPRTRKNLIKFKLWSKLEEVSNIRITKSLGYLDFLKLFSKASCVLTDSGGIQEESSILKIPCITLRNNTERPETIEFGTNVLIGLDMDKLKREMQKILLDSTYLKGKSDINPFGDGKAAERIIEIVKDLYKKNKLTIKKLGLWEEIPKRFLKKIKEEDHNFIVKKFEEKYDLKIQLIFDKKGNPTFPYNNTLLQKDDTVLILSLKY
ncbi:MAG: non-hydrolyzing UDP-N-acetylglucosamine 2-epimerase [Candidatus Odinarchaeota archaeon]